MSREATTARPSPVGFEEQGWQRVGLLLEPLDVLVFRDARSATHASASHSLLPTPAAIAGALTTGLLRLARCDWEKLGTLLKGGRPLFAAIPESVPDGREWAWIAVVRFRGPWFAREALRGEGLEVLVPAPATVGHLHNGWEARRAQLRPLPESLPLEGWLPPEPSMRPLCCLEAGKFQPARGYLAPKGLRQFLQGEEVDDDQLVPESELYLFDQRRGVGLGPDERASAPDLLYATRFLVLRKGVSLYVEVDLPGDTRAPEALRALGTVFLGGERRSVHVHVLENPYSWPSVVARDKDERALVVLTTPGLFYSGWRPAAFEGRLAAASVPEPLPFSGWDLARGRPKPTRFAAAAGSVYLLNERVVLLPDPLSDHAEDRRLGWGCYVQGIWRQQ
jgi:CRISPR-associated protein Cmr3